MSTAPWFLLPDAVSGGGIIVLARLARLAGWFWPASGAQQLFDRIGRVALVALPVTTAGAVAINYADYRRDRPPSAGTPAPAPASHDDARNARQGMSSNERIQSDLTPVG